MAKLIQISRFKYFVRNFSSALYITGDKAHNNFVVLTPYIDFDEQLKNKDDLVKNIHARKLNISLEKIEQRWNFYKMIDDHKTVLEATKTEISNLIAKLKQDDPERNKSDIEKLILHGKLVKDDLKNLKDFSYGVEENANVAVLGLPNILHSKTPLDSELVIHEFLDKPNHVSASHLEIGKDMIEYISPIACFLKSDAALFEFAITNYFQNCLLSSDFTQFSNADFARSIVVEGCGTSYLDDSNIFTLEDPHNDKTHEISRLHLVGGASIYSFMAYFAKHLVKENNLPLKLFSMGRKYKPSKNKSQSTLFNLSQQSVTTTFTATIDDVNIMDETLKNLTDELVKIYEPLGCHFRLVYVPANKLEISESLRLSIQMYSNNLQNYVEVGHLSVYDSYISKRLLFTYNHDNERCFPKVIAGDLLNVQKFLGCAIENNCSNNVALLSPLLQKHL